MDDYYFLGAQYPHSNLMFFGVIFAIFALIFLNHLKLILQITWPKESWTLEDHFPVSFYHMESFHACVGCWLRWCQSLRNSSWSHWWHSLRHHFWWCCLLQVWSVQGQCCSLQEGDFTFLLLHCSIIIPKYHSDTKCIEHRYNIKYRDRMWLEDM